MLGSIDRIKPIVASTVSHLRSSLSIFCCSYRCGVEEVSLDDDSKTWNTQR